MTCRECGLTLTVGMYPFCHGEPARHVRQASSVIGDEIQGGFVQEHFGHQPEVFYSKQAMAKRADALGLRPMVRNAGPHDTHVPRWSSVDLEAATALVQPRPRRTRVADLDDVPCETAVFTVEAV